MQEVILKTLLIVLINFFIVNCAVAQVKISNDDVATIRSKYRSLRQPTQYAEVSDTELSLLLTGQSLSYGTPEFNEVILEYQLRKDITSNHPSTLLLPDIKTSSKVIAAHRDRQQKLVASLKLPFSSRNSLDRSKCKSLELESDFDVALKSFCQKGEFQLPCKKEVVSEASELDINNLAIENYAWINYLVGESDGVIYENICDGIGVNLNQHALKDKGMLKNPLALNHVINNDYFNLSVSLANYTGGPLLPNWATFAQFGSRTVGRSMHLMEEAMKILDDMDTIINRGQISQISELPDHFTRLQEIANEPNMPMNGIKKFFDKLKISNCNMTTSSGYVTCGYLMTGNAILDTKAELDTLYNAFKVGNRMIYNHMAPVLSDFLAKNNQAKNCTVNVDLMYSPAKWAEIDPNGLIRKALKEYQKAHDIDKLIQQTKDTKKIKELQTQRMKAVTRANLLIVTQEQILAQEHLYHHDLEAYNGMKTVLYDPVGSYPLVDGNWADFNTRMGIPKEVKDFTGQKVITVTPEKINELLSFKLPGTITDYFDDRTNSSRAQVLFAAPVIPTSAKSY